ncbi:MAG: hypothetical protein HY928_09165 [Elusimicrobia bacterium]|nr:hypothetical protein [Elusimicrobiota bacterium]
MGLFDWFVGDLECPACGVLSPADGRTNAQTKLRDKPYQMELAAGDELLVTRASALDAGYVPNDPFPPGDDLRILQTWECPSCGAPFNWLQVVVRDGRILSVEAVSPDPDVLAAAHYIDEEALRLLKPPA